MSTPKPEEEVIFNVARRIDTRDDRSAYIDRVCGADCELRNRIESLLRVSTADRAFLEAPASELRATLDEAILERPGAVIGPYKLLEQIGEGGFGVVFMAEQQQPVRRKVALKIIKPGMDSRQVVARFEAERAALALMDHPHIARVLDGGVASSGRPYFVMELVRGVPVTEVCDREQLSVRDRLALAVTICDAVQHAHQKGVIHRDLKPANILVTWHDGVAVVKVIDFGIAKAIGNPLTDKTLFTNFAQLVGTPLYMSPEQMELSGLDIDTRADIYALGVLIYELLTGTTPFDREQLRAAPFDEMRRIVREVEPARPSARISTIRDMATASANRRSDPKRLSRLLRGELDWIVMKCLEKDRTRRYASAGDLARDLQRFLAHEPVEARPPSTAYRLSKFFHRNRQLAIVGSLVALLLVGGVIGTTWGLIQARDAQQAEAQRAESETEQRLRAEEAERVARQRAEAEGEQRRRAEIAETEARRQEKIALDKLALATAVREFLADDLLGQAGSRSQADRSHEPKPNLTVREALDRAAASMRVKFKDHPEVEANLRRTLGRAYQELEEFPKAIEQYRLAAALFERLHGPDHGELLQTRHLLAGALREDWKLAEAIAIYEKLREQHRKTFPADDVDALNTRQGLANAWRLVGRHREATALLKEVYEARKRLHGPNDQRTLGTLDSLATTYIDSGHPGRAVELLQEVREGMEKVLSPDHPDLQQTLGNLAVALSAAKNYAAAHEICTLLVEMSTRTFGPDDHRTLRAQAGLASAMIGKGDIELGIDLYRKVGDRLEKLNDRDYPQTVEVRANLATAYWKRKQYDEAIPLLEHALAVRKKALGEANFSTLTTMANLGCCYRDAKRLKEAMPLLETAFRGAREFGQLNWVGEELFAIHCNELKRPEAMEVLKEMIEVDRARFPAESPELATRCHGHGRAYMRVADRRTAETFFREALAIRQATDPDDWHTFDSRFMLGTSLLGQDLPDEAEPLLVEGYAGMKQRRERRARYHDLMISKLELAVKFYERQKRPEDLARWKAELAELRSGGKK